MNTAQSESATKALEVLRGIQLSFRDLLEKTGSPFERVSWLRDDGLHGGGDRFEAKPGGFFNRASINISQVHYDDLPSKPLGSATALSTIVHPAHPSAPSLHLHLSWTEPKAGSGYWRMMADLNPSQPDENPEPFRVLLSELNPSLAEDAFAQGDRYFWIPGLGRHRGVCHYYLEVFNSGHEDDDLQLAASIGEKVIHWYTSRIEAASQGKVEAAHEKLQLAYHTLYFYQVLTLDRGTTAGLLVHDQNDEGILGSLPAKVDVELLKAWKGQTPEVQQPLLEALIDVVGTGGVDLGTKLRLAKVVRRHYQDHPEALDLQARADRLPPTISNHTTSS